MEVVQYFKKLKSDIFAKLNNTRLDQLYFL